jgi:formylglycine-generating enzyme required for sulfatase activity
MPWTWKTRLVIGAIPAAAAVMALLMVLSPQLVASGVPLPDLVDIAPASFQYRVEGDFTRGGRPVTAPIVAAITHTLAVMRHQVTVGEYRRCVDAGACRRGDDETSAADVPMVKISWWDAAGYAVWLSRSTGMSFRLPSDEEWVYAAGSRFRDSEGQPDIDTRDPGKRALDRYEQETAIKNESDPQPRPVGHFGANEHGLLDVAGNVSEWTDSCFARGIVDAGGEPSTTTVDCGVRVVEGRHRAYLTDFIRDARAGGCTAGLPPSNLGFRLLLDDDWRRRLHAFAGRVRRAFTDQAI